MKIAMFAAVNALVGVFVSIGLLAATAIRQGFGLAVGSFPWVRVCSAFDFAVWYLEIRIRPVPLFAPRALRPN